MDWRDNQINKQKKAKECLTEYKDLEMKIFSEDLSDTTKACVATIGFFDGVHRGHRFLISQLEEIARGKGLKSAVITFPVHPRKVLNDDYQPQSLSTRDEKIELLGDSGIDYCILMPFTHKIAELSACEFMKLLKEKYNVNALVIGYDHRFGHNRSEGFNDYCRYGEELGIEVIQAKEFDNDKTAVSSSAVRRLLSESKIEKANDFLGYRYFISGKVINGYKIGRKLGFPTANISLCDKEKILPGNGVYAVFAYIDGVRKKGMLNIGNRPTIDEGHEKSIEVNIFDFNGDIYDKVIRIEFVDFMRHEQKFESVEQLVEQLDKDKDYALNKLKEEK